MKYDFTSIMDRRGKDALAIDGVGRGRAPGAPGTRPTGTFSPRRRTSVLSSAGRSSATA